MTIIKQSAQEFARRMSLRISECSWLIGAGTSAAAGIPTGYDMIADFKARLFCADANLSRREIDPSDPLWISRINAHFETRGELPPPGHPSEYALAFERVFPEADDRRRYIEVATRRGSPSFGHRVLAALISSRRIPCVFSTNFDSLAEQSVIVVDDLLPANEKCHLTVAALDSAERAERCMRESSWPLLAKLHGDYKSVQLKNIGAELISQDERLRRCLVDASRRFGLIVVGYSGRDESVMSALMDAATASAFPAGVYWIQRPGMTLLPAATAFLERASQLAGGAHLVEAENFDELMGELNSQIALQPALQAHVDASRPDRIVTPVEAPSREGGQFPVLRCLMFPIVEMPQFARRVKLQRAATTAELRKLLKDSGVRGIVASLGREVAAFGNDEELLGALQPLSPVVEGTIPIDPSGDSWMIGLIYDALIRALCRGRPLRPHLRHSGHSLVINPPLANQNDDHAKYKRGALTALEQAYDAAIVGIVPGLDLPFAEGLRLRIEQIAGRWVCTFDPITYVERPRAQGADAGSGCEQTEPVRWTDPAVDWRREQWAPRYNPAWSKIVDGWAALLLPHRITTVRSFGLQDGQGVNATFRLLNVTGFSRPLRASGRN